MVQSLAAGRLRAEALIASRSLIAAHSLVVSGTNIPAEVLVTGAAAKVKGPIAGTGAEAWVNATYGLDVPDATPRRERR